MSTPLTAIVLCAGKGTRMKSELPKVLHPLLGRPLCAYPIGRALELGARKVVAVVGHQASAVETELRVQFPGERVQIALQAEQKGTAHAVGCARAALEGASGAALIVYGDVPLLTTRSLERLCEAHRQAGGVLSIVTTTPVDPTGYGRVVREGGKIARVVEQKDATEKQREIREVNAGIYMVDLAFLWPALERLSPANAQGELYLTDLVAAAAAKGPVGSVEIDSEEARGVNDRAQLSECADVLRQRIRERLMREGVTLVDPAAVWIDEDVEIGPDSCIEPMVSIGAGCRLGRNVVVGQGCVLRGARIGDDTRLHPYTVIEEASVAEGCILGPFARLRPGTELSRNVHLGNFVETKKTRIGEGSKANHLSYLGDAEIGSGVNVGAGTITCNYDGKNKHKTVLEDGVFIGSDTQLVAPVRVKKGAYVGAGTTVTREVPEGSLAISRSPQVNKEGWVASKKRG